MEISAFIMWALISTTKSLKGLGATISCSIFIHSEVLNLWLLESFLALYLSFRSNHLPTSLRLFHVCDIFWSNCNSFFFVIFQRWYYLRREKGNRLKIFQYLLQKQMCISLIYDSFSEPLFRIWSSIFMEKNYTLQVELIHLTLIYWIPPIFRTLC